jgi:formylglycine-generating enzyme required for sulfatase activity
MLGNVFEWVQDRYGRPEQANDDITIQEIANITSPRLLLGGSFGNPAAGVRSALRDWSAPSNRLSSSGFRPSRTYP